MNKEKQRIKIAEACGWILRHQDGEQWAEVTDGIWGLATDVLPDYLNDLNAMHEAEKVLNQQQCRDYAGRLGRGADGCFLHVTATAAQRAKAFLRTLGLWEEEI